MIFLEDEDLKCNAHLLSSLITNSITNINNEAQQSILACVSLFCKIPLTLKMNNMKKIIISAAFLTICFTGLKANNNISDNGKGNNVHNILSTQLPSSLLKNIKKEYSSYWITELVEKDNNKKPAYFITLENADQTVKLSCDNAKIWTVISVSPKAE